MPGTRDQVGHVLAVYVPVLCGVAAVVATLVLVAIARSRRGRPIVRRREAARVELLYAGGLVVAAGLLLWPTLTAERQVRAVTSTPALELRATAFQWGWRFRYPDGTVVESAPGVEPVVAVPLDEPVRVTVTATDVIHAIWIPELRFKLDAIPGQENVFETRFTRPGRFEGLCAEFCGIGHARMGFLVDVVPRAGLDAWLAEQAAA